MWLDYNQNRRSSAKFILMKRFNAFKVIILCFLASTGLMAQVNDGEKHIVLVKGQAYIDTIQSNFPITAVSALVENCYVSSIENIGNKSRKITIHPPQSNPDYTGNARVTVQYTDGYKPRYITWFITYVDSKIRVMDDFIAYSSNDTIVVNPLVNDSSTIGGLIITGLGFVSGGTATYSDQQVVFTPDADADAGYVVYGVKDSLNATSSGMIRFTRQDSVIVSTDTLRYTLLNTRSQTITLPSDSFYINSTPTKGSVIALAGHVMQYTPVKGATGQEVLDFVDQDQNTVVVIIDLLERVQNTSSVRDDVFYTSKNTPITFDVFANDLSANFPIVNYSSELVRDTLGVFTYTPPSGFSGVKNFTYKVNYGQWQSTGKIEIYIGNYQPLTTQDYTFQTLKNNPLVLTYDVPIDGYSFNILNQPAYGTAEIFDNTNVTEGCNTFFSKSTLIYTPDYQYFGNDSFDIEYCVDNNPCVVYKIGINIADAVEDSLCHCTGPDCVWAGDMNGDGRVSVTDLLALGRFIGISGNSRDQQQYPIRTGESADDWKWIQPSGLNVKHLDADGDGIISEADAQSIHDYYSNIHQLVPEEVLAIKDYPFYLIPSSTEVDSGDLLEIDILIGDNNFPVADLYGLAFGININPEMIDSASMFVEYGKNSWFTTGSPSMEMTKQPSDGVIHTALTKVLSIVEDEIEGIKPVGSSGFGQIGRLVFIVEDEIEGIRSDADYTTLRVRTNGIQIESAEGKKYQLPDTYTDIKVRRKKTEPVPSEDKLIVYPNPAKDRVILHFNGRNHIKGYTLFDQMGAIIKSVDELDQQTAAINTSALADGVYFIKAVTSQGVITKKLVVMNKM
ncbi:MAG: cellulosome anchoring protein cohesin subunit [Bacteroidetes bacterium OLB9]|nr:MAG: cellulosome anchoring protein cohesin subunit [Bacteroidetes bacterium OLB9]